MYVPECFSHFPRQFKIRSPHHLYEGDDTMRAHGRELYEQNSGEKADEYKAQRFVLATRRSG